MYTADRPPIVEAARIRAELVDFVMSCDRHVGELLAVLAAASPQDAKILELGTGVGMGLAWIVHGLGTRNDASVLSVDSDETLLTLTRTAAWPKWVEFLLADGARVVAEEGPFDLIFADAAGGKIDRLDATIAALAPRGLLVVDDMNPALHTTDGLLAPLQAVRATLMSHRELIAVEIPHSTHVILAAKI